MCFVPELVVEVAINAQIGLSRLLFFLTYRNPAKRSRGMCSYLASCWTLFKCFFQKNSKEPLEISSGMLR